MLSPGASGGQCKVGIGASSSTSSPASEDDADLAAVTARCIISRTPSFDEPPLPPGPLVLPPLPLALPKEPELLPAPELLVTPSGKMTREKESVYLKIPTARTIHMPCHARMGSAPSISALLSSLLNCTNFKS